MKHYEELRVDVLFLNDCDIVTASGFDGGDHEFGDPNDTTWG